MVLYGLGWSQLIKCIGSINSILLNLPIGSACNRESI